MVPKRGLFFLLAAFALIIGSGCAPKEPLPPSFPAVSSHIDVPFIAPRSNLCASTSIEMVSSYWKQHASYHPILSPEELDRRTLIPEKKGTLQAELSAAARSDGLLVYPLEPTFEALIRELEAAHPVIVLVNRGYSWYPFWHYLPVTGYDPQRRVFLTHFADTPDEPVAAATFDALWKRSGRWGVVLLPPDELPATAKPRPFLQAAFDLETTGKADEAIRAYQSATERWPTDTDLLLALANAQYTANRLQDAQQSYQRLLMIDPHHPMALNNLADLLCRTNRPEEALKRIGEVSTDDPKLQPIITATKKEIEAGCLPTKEK